MNADQMRRLHGRLKGQCTWCGEQVPGRRRTWCSERCVEAFKSEHDWAYIRGRVRERDGGVCRHCGCDTDKVRRLLRLVRQDGFQYRKHFVEFLAREGFHEVCRDLWEAHHVTPRIQGGTDAMENLETVCMACHKVASAELARSRAGGGA